MNASKLIKKGSKSKSKLKDNTKKVKVSKDSKRITRTKSKNDEVIESGLKSSKERWILLGWVIGAICVPLVLMFFR